MAEIRDSDVKGKSVKVTGLSLRTFVAYDRVKPTYLVSSIQLEGEKLKSPKQNKTK